MRARPTQNSDGFTLAELMVAMFIMSLVSLTLVLIYNQSLVTFRHSSSKLEAEQRAREATKRLIPMIASGIPAGPNDAIIEPALNAKTTQLRLYSTTSFVRTVYGGPPVTFNPRNKNYGQIPGQPLDYSRLRVWWTPEPGVDPHDPELSPGGQVGRLMVDPDTPAEPGDDRIIARHIYSVEFENQGSHQIHVTVNLYGNVRTANQNELRHFQYDNVVHMPFYTQPAGGG